MTQTPALYRGRVMHMRLIPRQHQFRYRVFSLLLDIDRLEETAAALRLFRLGRGGVLSLDLAEHGARDGTALRPWVDALLAAEGQAPADQVMLLSMPRVFGFGFNPISVYFCYRAGRLDTVIYQVKNTFGDQITYVASTDDETVHRHSAAKAMYVSPFIEMDQTYRFCLHPPGEAFALRIRQAGPAGETLIATHNAERRPLTDGALLKAALALPFMSLKVFAGIHWEALRLFLKGVRFNRYSQSQVWAERSPAE